MTPKHLHRGEAEKAARLVGRKHRAALIGDQRQSLEHRIGAERDDDRRQPKADRKQAVDEAQNSAERDADKRGQPRIDARNHQKRGNDRGKIEHPSDREVDFANGEQEHHAERQHALERGVAENRQQIDRIEKARPRDSDDRDHDQQGDDDADLVRQAKGPPAWSRRFSGFRLGRRQMIRHAIFATAGSPLPRSNLGSEPATRL